jgi:hypothetical protein
LSLCTSGNSSLPPIASGPIPSPRPFRAGGVRLSRLGSSAEASDGSSGRWWRCPRMWYGMSLKSATDARARRFLQQTMQRRKELPIGWAGEQPLGKGNPPKAAWAVPWPERALPGRREARRSQLRRRSARSHDAPQPGDRAIPPPPCRTGRAPVGGTADGSIPSEWPNETRAQVLPFGDPFRAQGLGSGIGTGSHASFCGCPTLPSPKGGNESGAPSAMHHAAWVGLGVQGTQCGHAA